MVFEKQLRIEAGIDVDRIHRVLAIFRREDEAGRGRGVYIRVGTPDDCMTVQVRETKTTISIRIANIIQGGRYVNLDGSPLVPGGSK